jgi:Spy/CpxP family protein refolding chaperone
MKILKVSAIAALAVGALLACSTATAQDNADKGKGGRKGGFGVDQRLEYYNTELKLTDEQKPKVKAVLEDQEKKLQGVPREERRDKMREMRPEMAKKMKEILTAEQYTKWEQLRGGPGGKKGGKNDGGEKKDSTEKKN